LQIAPQVALQVARTLPNPGAFAAAIHGVETSLNYAAALNPIKRAVRHVLSQRQPPWALEITGLSKRFERPAVDGLDLTVRTGEFYALLGANGAGKTTTLKMVVGLLAPDAGAISVLGIDALADPVAAKQVMAWISDEPMIYDKLTPFEYLEFVAGLWGVDAAVGEARAPALRRILQRHAAEGGAGRRPGA
jgi:ABC-type transport system involved in cytochrome bd biosynthesis fused ATPase/permease subunit